MTPKLRTMMMVRSGVRWAGAIMASCRLDGSKLLTGSCAGMPVGELPCTMPHSENTCPPGTEVSAASAEGQEDTCALG